MADREVILKALQAEDLTPAELQDVTGIDAGKIDMALLELQRAKLVAVAVDGSWRAFPRRGAA